MQKKNLSLMIAMLTLAACGGDGGTDGASTPATAAPTATLSESATTTTATAPVDSSQFLMDAYRDGLSEIQLSRLALQKTMNSDVRNFAQRMIDDHTRVNADIMQLAQSKNISLPTDLSAEQKTEADRLAGLSGEAFDRAYMASNVATHEKDVAAARLQARQGSDADVRMLAVATLPILELHLALAEEINGLLDPSAFLVTAYQDGLAEIQLSQLALQKSANDEVRRFAQRMIDDHSQANNRITALAQQKGVTLPTATTPAQQAAADELARFAGADFDKAYMDKNVIVHVQDVRQAAQQFSQGRDADVRNLAQQTLPVLAAHLATAIDIDTRIEPSFLFRAAQDGNAEIQLAHLALARSSNEQVQAFARQMIADHGAANVRIMNLAQQRNLPLPIEASPEQARDFVELTNRSGAAFDRDYMDINVRNHRADVTLVSEQAQNATDPDIKALAQNLLPVLRAHLTRAMEILQQLPAG